ncbi:MAG: cytidylate kinase-like family protein [Paludibacteraceae bacterium]|jgi:cytidylate kinase|nr:cytidylate kinase-like family protein [Paludibacteraceae bacterium]MBP5290755.1 cytidylate kinase-like family protein [Paludibacteraceae bacterium]
MDNNRFIVTIGREFGTGGRQIATELAEMLGVKLYDRKLLDPIKEHYNMTQWQIDKMKAEKPKWWNEPLSKEMYKEEEALVLQLAKKESFVLLGRTGFHIFRDDPRTFKVFLMAEKEYRRDKVARRLNINEGSADALIDKVDEARENFTLTFSGKTRYDARNYDLVLNVTGQEPTEVARFIADCVQRKMGRL